MYRAASEGKGLIKGGNKGKSFLGDLQTFFFFFFFIEKNHLRMTPNVHAVHFGGSHVATIVNY